MKNNPMKNFILFTIIILVSSCGIMKQKGFTKQKYTKFKTRGVFSKKVAVDDKIVEKDNFTASLSNDKIVFASTYPQINLIEEAPIVSTVINYEVESSPTLIEEIGPSPAKWSSPYFEYLDSEQQKQNLIDFNRIQNNSKKLFCYGILLVFGFIVTGYMAWFLSFKALKLVRGINHKNYSKQFRRKYNGMRFLKYFGMAISIASIVGIVFVLINQAAS